MGFLKTVETNSGITVSDAYHRILNIVVDKNIAQCSLGVYKSRVAANEGKEIVKSFVFEFEPENTDNTLNIFKQGYAYLFAQPGYENVEHVLEGGQVPL